MKKLLIVPVVLLAIAACEDVPLEPAALPVPQTNLVPVPDAEVAAHVESILTKGRFYLRNSVTGTCTDQYVEVVGTQDAAIRGAIAQLLQDESWLRAACVGGGGGGAAPGNDRG